MKYITTLIFAIAIVIITLQLRSCFCGGGQQTRDTVSVKIDTVWQRVKDTILLDHPVPYKVVYYKEKVLRDTLETVETVLQHVDSARILNQYLSVRPYDTTIQVQYGTIQLIDTVTQNRITGRSVFLTQDIPIVKETVTLTQPKRVVLYFSIAAIGNKDHLPYASGAGLGLKLKNDAFIEGMGYFLSGDQPAMYGASIKIPIRFRKH